MTPGRMYDILLGYALQYPFSVTSGHRTLKRNETVGGSAGSRHLRGMAFDIVFDDGVAALACRHAMRTDHPEWDVVEEDDHTHVEWDPR